MSLRPIIENLDLSKVDLGNIDLLFQFKNSETAVLYFHGFPGPYEVNKGDNLRFVDFLFDEIKQTTDFYYPLYTLCKREPFSFSRLLEMSECALDFLVNKKAYKRTILMGQSFGTVLALSLLGKYSFTKVNLITPFFQIPTGEGGEKLVSQYSKLYPDLLRPQLLKVLCQEFQELAENAQPLSFIPLYHGSVEIYAAENDEIIPINQLQKLSEVNKKVNLNTLKGEFHVLYKKKDIAEMISKDLNA